MRVFAIALSVLCGSAAKPLPVPGVGLLQTNTLGNGITEALGIPYAQAPIGERRFAPPEVLPASNAELDATKFGKVCMQFAMGYEAFVTEKVAAHMGEDCLTLNVWAPSNAKNLPVYFWIHGGAFLQGSGSWFNGSSLASKGIVVVTINYRLGVFGFLNLDTLQNGSTANVSSGGAYGLLDQQFAMKWVQANIKAFGGDPKAITIGGESAGSLSVCDHLHIPSSAGLFQRAIMESGSCGTGPLSELVVKRAEAQQLAVKLFKSLGVKDMKALRRCEGLRVLATSFSVLDEDNATTGWFPSVDGMLLSKNPKDLPIASVAVDVIAGTNTAEGDATMPTDLRGPMGLTTALFYEIYVSENLAPEVLRYYPAPPSSSSPEVVRSSYLQLVTDFEWTCPKQKLNNKLLQAGARVRSYSFGFWPNKTGDGDLDDMVTHGSEESFVWDHWPTDDGFVSPYVAAFTKETFNKNLSGIMSTYWTEFVKTGIPSKTPLEWKLLNNSVGPELTVRSNTLNQPVLTLQDGPQAPCEFWDDFASSEEGYRRLLAFKIPSNSTFRSRWATSTTPQVIV